MHRVDYYHRYYLMVRTRKHIIVDYDCLSNILIQRAHFLVSITGEPYRRRAELHQDWCHTPRLSPDRRADATGTTLLPEPLSTPVTERDPPEGWTVWNDEPDGRRILAYRPDVFDAESFPPACMPTLHVAAGAPNRPAAEAELGSPSVWRVEFYLEPAVELSNPRTYDSREAALEGAYELAAAFVRGELDYRKAYQVPRDAYLSELDELLGE